MEEQEFFVYPIIHLYAEDEAEATDKVLEAIFTGGVGEIPGWLSESAVDAMTLAEQAIAANNQAAHPELIEGQQETAYQRVLRLIDSFFGEAKQFQPILRDRLAHHIAGNLWPDKANQPVFTPRLQGTFDALVQAVADFRYMETIIIRDIMFIALDRALKARAVQETQQ